MSRYKYPKCLGFSKGFFRITQQDNCVFIHIARPLYEFVQNFRFAHFLFAIQAKLAYVNKLNPALAEPF